MWSPPSTPSIPFLFSEGRSRTNPQRRPMKGKKREIIARRNDAAANNLRVLGSPNPGQSFGRGLSGPQATEVKMDPVGSWAATNLTVHSSNSFLGPSFWVGALGSYSWVAFFDVFRFFAFSNLEEGAWIRSSLGGPNYGRYRGEATFFFFPTLRTFFLA